MKKAGGAVQFPHVLSNEEARHAAGRTSVAAGHASGRCIPGPGHAKGRRLPCCHPLPGEKQQRRRPEGYGASDGPAV